MMEANTFGSVFRISTFGESHGPAIGVLIQGCPSGVPIDERELQKELNRRRPGFTTYTSSRNESDRLQILSGLFEGKTLGTPILMLTLNEDARPQDYQRASCNPRVGHADDVWREKFQHSDFRGGGRTSGRETVARVMAGALAKQVLQSLGQNARVSVVLSQVGPLRCEDNPLDPSLEVRELLAKAKVDGESYGARLRVMITGVTRGLGQPVFHKLKADLAAALFGIGAVQKVSLGEVGGEGGDDDGSDFFVAEARGSVFHKKQNYGGIRGGISTGEAIQMSVEFKPTASILEVAKSGRHDPCIGIRGSVVVEHMIYLVLLDHVLWKRLDRQDELL